MAIIEMPTLEAQSHKKNKRRELTPSPFSEGKKLVSIA